MPTCSWVRCAASAETVGVTGFEEEALTAVLVGLLTGYDTCKAMRAKPSVTLAWVSMHRNSPKPELAGGRRYALMRSGRLPHQGMGTGALSRPEATTMGRCARRWKCTCTASLAMRTLAGMSTRSR